MKWILSLLVLVGCARLDYPAIGVHEKVVRGDQAELDQGYVVDETRTLPADIWLAGHRTTHGAVFRNLPSASIGDEVCVYGKCYHVTQIIHHTGGIIYWTHKLGTLVLQTSEPGGDLLVVCN